jgi:hypothetical protein
MHEKRRPCKAAFRCLRYLLERWLFSTIAKQFRCAALFSVKWIATRVQSFEVDLLILVGLQDIRWGPVVQEKAQANIQYRKHFLLQVFQIVD